MSKVRGLNHFELVKFTVVALSVMPDIDNHVSMFVSEGRLVSCVNRTCSVSPIVLELPELSYAIAEARPIFVAVTPRVPHQNATSSVTRTARACIAIDFIEAAARYCP